MLLNPEFGINSSASLIHRDLINPFQELFRHAATYVLNIIPIWRISWHDMFFVAVDSRENSANVFFSWHIDVARVAAVAGYI